jgi:hypothetical protein
MIVTAVHGSDSQRAQALALKLDPEYPVPGAELDRRFGGPKIGFDTTYRQVRVTLAFDFASHTLARHSRSERIEQCTNFASAALTMDERANQGSQTIAMIAAVVTTPIRTSRRRLPLSRTTLSNSLFNISRKI